MSEKLKWKDGMAGKCGNCGWIGAGPIINESAIVGNSKLCPRCLQQYLLPHERRAADERVRELVETLKESIAEIKEIQMRLFRLSDLHDNMDHWLRMQEMNSDLQDKVIESIATVLRKHGKESE